MRVIEHPEVNDFERALLDALLAGPLDILATLREQITSARVVLRELSGAGFFLKFEVSPSTRRVEPANFEISDVYFDLEGTEHGGGSVLFIRDGVVTTLEGYSHAGGWPDEPRQFRLYYFDGPTRNMPKVAAEIASRAALSRNLRHDGL